MKIVIKNIPTITSMSLNKKTHNNKGISIANKLTFKMHSIHESYLFYYSSSGICTILF